MDQSSIGKFIAQLRHEANMTQGQVASKMRVTDKSVSRWENGKTLPDISLMLELADVLKTTLPELIMGRKLTKSELSEQKELIENIIEYDSNRKYEKNKAITIRLVVGIVLISVAALNRCYNFMRVVFMDIDITEFLQGFLFGIGIGFELVSVYNLSHKMSLQEKKKAFLKKATKKR